MKKLLSVQPWISWSEELQVLHVLGAGGPLTCASLSREFTHM